MAGLPHAPVRLRVRLALGRGPATVSGRRTMTSAQSGLLASRRGVERRRSASSPRARGAETASRRRGDAAEAAARRRATRWASRSGYREWHGTSCAPGDRRHDRRARRERRCCAASCRGFRMRRRGPRSDPATTPRCWRRPTAASSSRPTRWCTAPTSGSPGRRRSTSAGRRPPRTSPMSPRWARGRRRSSSRSWRRPTTPVAVLEGIADGLREALAALAPGCGVVGGDLSVSTVLTIAVTAFGDLEGRAPVLRSGARAGRRGRAARRARRRGARASRCCSRGHGCRGRAGCRARGRRCVRGIRGSSRAQLAPEPPIADGVAAALAGATAMLDVCDGLARDARRIAEASGVGIDFDGAALGPDLRVALAGGEDHGLLATFPAGARAARAVRGRRPRRRRCRRDPRRRRARSAPTGWDPYSGWDGRSG